MSDVSPGDIDHIEQLITILRRRQRVLESQHAHYGNDASPAHILLELEDVTRELEKQETELRRLRPRPADDRNPYLGLLTFQEAAADRFFGRDALVADLTARVTNAAVLAVLGASGSGKSSVVRAGLIPMLKSGALSGSERWRYIVLRPGARPLDVLAAELARQQGDPTRVIDYAKALTDDKRALLLLADAVLDRSVGQRLALVVDQFEELWTLTQAAERKQFVDLLVAAASPADTPLLIILAMRADFLHRAAQYPDLAKVIGEHDVIVSPMQVDELRAAIERPAHAVGGSFEPGLVDELIEQTAGRDGALPLLEYALQELWKRCESGLMTWTAYRALGGIEGALAVRADAILAERYTPEQQHDLRQLLLRLVQPGEGVADTRRVVLLEDLAPAGESVEVMQALLQPLVDARLLVTTTSGQPSAANPEIADGQPAANGEGSSPLSHSLAVSRSSSVQVELAHEALIRAWPAFRAWIDAARADLRLQLQLEDAAKEWAASGERLEFLWSGLRLANAEAWHARARLQLNEREQRFLDVSRAAEQKRTDDEDAVRREREALLEARAAAERRSASRLRVFLAILSLLLLVSIGVAVFAVYQQRTAARQARVSRSQELAAQSRALHEQFPQRSLLLAVEALRVTGEPNEPPVPGAEQTLRDMLANTEGIGLGGHTAPVRALAFSRDGKWLATRSDDHTVRLWDMTAAGLAVYPIILRHQSELSYQAMAFSSDGKWLVTGSDDQAAQLWDMTAADIAAHPIILRHKGTVSAVAFSPDGKRLATGSSDHTVRLWDMTASDVANSAAVLRHTDRVNAVAFSPDGQWLATGDDTGSVRLWNMTAIGSAEIPIVLQHQSSIDELFFSPDSKRLAARNQDGVMWFWDLTSKDVTARAKVLREKVLGVVMAFSSDWKWLAIVSNTVNVQVWDLEITDVTARPTLSLPVIGADAVAFSPDGKRLAIGSHEGSIRLWDLTVTDATVLPAVWHSHEDWIGAIAFSPDGKWLATTSADCVARLWDLTVANPIASPKVSPSHQNRLAYAAFSPNGKWLITRSDDGATWLRDMTREDQTYRPWNLTAVDVKANPVQFYYDSLVNTTAFSLDGKWLVTSGADHVERLWDLTAVDLAASSIILRHEGDVDTVAFSPDSKRLATGSYDQTVRLWDLTAADPAAKPAILHHEGRVWALAFSSDGKRLITRGEHSTVWVWDLTLADVASHPTVWHNIGGGDGTLSPDGKWLVTSDRLGNVAFYNLTVVYPALSPMIIHLGAPVNAMVAFSADSRRLAIGIGQGTVQLLDLTAANPASRPTILHFEGGLRMVAFSPDGKRLATDTGAVQLWDLTTTDPSIGAITLPHTAAAVAFSPDSKRLVTVGYEGTLLWDLPLETLTGLACRTAGRNLTWDEWQLYFPGEDYHATCANLPLHFTFITHLVQQGANLAKQGKIPEALTAYKDAQQRDPTFEIDAGLWNALCQYGSLEGKAAAVIDACDRAVAQAPNNGAYRDSRGLARALTGNIAGAIDDFNAFVPWARSLSPYGQWIVERKDWIAALQAGRSPFHQITLENVRDEWTAARGE